jgi:hypothetical protein
MQETCRHFRYRIPSEDADELRADDPEPCEICDNRKRSHRWGGNLNTEECLIDVQAVGSSILPYPTNLTTEPLPLFDETDPWYSFYAAQILQGTWLHGLCQVAPFEKINA